MYVPQIWPSNSEAITYQRMDAKKVTPEQSCYEKPQVSSSKFVGFLLIRINAPLHLSGSRCSFQTLS